MKDLLLAVIFLLFLVPGAVLAAQPSTTKTTGDKTITAEGHGASKQDALLQAKRAAVEEGIGVVLSSQTEVENFMLKKDKVITQSFGAVRSYTTIKEEQKGDTWSVKISAVVSLDSITADLMALKILLVSMDKPRTMVLIQEEGGQNAESTVFIPRSEVINEGDLVVTAGMGGQFPKGIVIGRIKSVDKNANYLFQKAEILPSVAYSRLEEVLVVFGDAKPDQVPEP